MAGSNEGKLLQLKSRLVCTWLIIKLVCSYIPLGLLFKAHLLRKNENWYIKSSEAGMEEGGHSKNVTVWR